jgi:hypothetical protein
MRFLIKKLFKIFVKVKKNKLKYDYPSQRYIQTNEYITLQITIKNLLFSVDILIISN